jgi:NAD(P)-dependent dehydrogenase (short-subunit alcohol dehydrogenase family)
LRTGFMAAKDGAPDQTTKMGARREAGTISFVNDLKGKTVLITGAARRLGKAVALAMAKAGANVAFTYRLSAEEARRTLQEIESGGAQGTALECDLRDEKSVKQAIEQARQRFGPIDILVNNAGVFETAKLDEITAEQWDEVCAVFVRAPFLVSKHCIPSLRSRRGRIIHMGSLGGEKPWATHAHYCSSKAALHMLTQVMAKALAPEIAVNCVAPGMIDAGDGDMQWLAQKTPMKKNGTPQDVCSAVMYFATSPHFITGQVLTVDGGLGLG